MNCFLLNNTFFKHISKHVKNLPGRNVQETRNSYLGLLKDARTRECGGVREGGRRMSMHGISFPVFICCFGLGILTSTVLPLALLSPLTPVSYAVHWVHSSICLCCHG